MVFSQKKTGKQFLFLGICYGDFYKFCGLLVSRKENFCISLVLVAHF
jgi:hypothetical protein